MLVRDFDLVHLPGGDAGLRSVCSSFLLSLQNSGEGLARDADGNVGQSEIASRIAARQRLVIETIISGPEASLKISRQKRVFIIDSVFVRCQPHSKNRSVWKYFPDDIQKSTGKRWDSLGWSPGTNGGILDPNLKK